jgi:hypothetical protein
VLNSPRNSKPSQAPWKFQPLIGNKEEGNGRGNNIRSWSI